jgi:hypothetical protein
MPIALILAGLFLGALALKAGETAGRQLWPLLVLLLLAFAVVALAAWHRRQMAHLHQLHLIVVGRYANTHTLRPWPKYCTDCGAEMSGWKACAAHDDDKSSPCMKLRLANDKAELAPGLPMEGYTAEVLETPGPDGESTQGPALGAAGARSKAIVDRLRARSGRA